MAALAESVAKAALAALAESAGNPQAQVLQAEMVALAATAASAELVD